MADPGEHDLEAVPDVPEGEQGGIKPEDTEPLKEDDVNPRRRQCTDLICCAVFVACLVGMFSMHMACFAQDHPFKILRPLDHAGNSCGVGEYKDWPLVYYPAKKMIHGGPLMAEAYYGNPKNRWSVCTSECPQAFSRSDRPWKCNEPSTATANNSEGATCTWYTEAASTPILGKYCVVGLASTEYTDTTGVVCSSAEQAVADVHAEAKRSFYDLGNMSTQDLQYLKTRVPPHHLWVVQAIEKSIQQDSMQYAEALDNVAKQAKEQHIVKVCADSVAKQEDVLVSFMTDVLNASTVLILSALMCLFFGLVYMFLVSKLVRVIVWGSIFVALVGFSVTGYLLWTQGIQVKDTGMLEEGQEEMVLAVICWIFAFILLVIVLLCRRALQLAVGISQSTSSFLLKNMGMLFLPQLIAIFEIGWVAYWLAAFAAILSTAKVKPADDLTQEISRFEIDGFIVSALLFHFYMGVWVHFFFEGLAVVTSSITVTEWYFSPKVEGSKPSSQFAVGAAFLSALLYHLGSIAFGSCILPIVVVLQLVVYLITKAQDKMGKDNALVKCMCCCLTCCLRCFTSCLQFISNSSYIMIGVQGKGFCSSAWDIFSLMARNPRRFVIFKGVMWTVDVACRFLLIGMTLAFGGMLLNVESLAAEVKSRWPPLLAIVIISYFISGLVASVYTTSGAALFVNFVVDEEISQITGRDFTLYAPSGLQGLLDAEVKKGKAKDDED